MSDFERLQGLLGLEPAALRLQRIKALSDEDLLRAIELLGDRAQMVNVAALPELRTECKARGLAPPKTSS